MVEFVSNLPYSLCSPWMDEKRQWALELMPLLAASANQDGENHNSIKIKLLNCNKLPSSSSLAKFCLTVINNINEVDEVQGIKVFYFSPQMNCPTFTFTSNDPEQLIKIRCQMVYEEERIIVPTLNCLKFTQKPSTIPRKMNWNKKMEQLFNDKLFCDVVINVQGTEFYANKFVLVARSPVFEAMFQTNWIEKELNYVLLYDVEPKVFNEFLRFLYTDDVEDWQTMAEKLLPLADKYLVDELKDECLSYIFSNQLTVDNSLDLLILFDRPTTPWFKEIILFFIQCQSPDSVATPEEWKNFSKSYFQLYKEIIAAWPTSQMI